MKNFLKRIIIRTITSLLMAVGVITTMMVCVIGATLILSRFFSDPIIIIGLGTLVGVVIPIPLIREYADLIDRIEDKYKV